MTDEYIKCSNCKCKYHNIDETIKEDFGYNRLGDKIYYENQKDKILEYNRIYRDDNKDKINEYNTKKTTCNTCGSIITGYQRLRHERSKKHQMKLSNGNSTC